MSLNNNNNIILYALSLYTNSRCIMNAPVTKPKLKKKKNLIDNIPCFVNLLVNNIRVNFY